MNKIITTILFISLYSCSFKGHDPLTMTKQAFLGKQLRIDGYYHTYFEGRILDVYFFYRNGVLLNAGGSFSNETEVVTYINKFYRNKKECDCDSELDWGVFNITDSLIAFEHWYPSDRPYPTGIREGKILNDTTFQITNAYTPLNGQRTKQNTLNEMYHFKQFSPKPDSTNKFIP